MAHHTTLSLRGAHKSRSIRLVGMIIMYEIKKNKKQIYLALLLLAFLG